jgi:hypothetical protein
MTRHLQVIAPPAASWKLSSRQEIEDWVAERRKVLGELVEREGLGHQLTLDERRAA